MKKLFAAAISTVLIAGTAIGGIGGYKSATAYAATGHKHTFAQVWSKGTVNHWHAATCGDDIVTDVAPHDTNGANGACSVCGYVKTEHVHTYNTGAWVNDTKNHWHAATCGHNVVTDIAKHTYDSSGVCVCGYQRPSASHTHTFEKTWSGDSVNHWKAADCGHKIVSEMAAHTINAKGVCTVCNKQVGEVKPVEVPDNVSAGGYNESLYAEWETTSITGVKASYQISGESGWTLIDENLIRMVDKDTARVDAVGLKAGTYNLKITGASEIIAKNIPVTAYDHSGYAHFGYTDGIGAYNDDGTLKDGALVIYVTDENKNDVSDYVYKNTANGLVKEDISKYLWNGHGGIGYILNNRGYANNTERENYGIQKLTFTYGAVAVRLLGNVNAEVSPSKADASKSLIDGLTVYNSTENGGSVGDEGRLARITNAKNLTIEGIGEDAGMYGWGIHFVSNDNLHKYSGAGKGFEVRNITFQNYPEDAIGMEGTQGKKVDATGSITGGASDADADLISPVERCWIHNNVFLNGFCADPTEGDKADGDGSCDFKRGQFYTLSYNYFANCHKTNLIGSSDNSVTYNVTMHHNWWNNVKARQPLARRANIHYYNNYVSGATDYVTSLRANCLVFSEANYYDGCKNVTQQKDGTGVAWGNVYFANYGDENSYVELTSRTQTVSNNCKFLYRNIDYSQFYIDSQLFYYDSVNQKSDCQLDDALTARVKVMMNAGVNGFGKTEEETAMNEYTPTSTVQLAESGDTNIAIPTSSGNSEVNGVLFRGFTGNGKGKGQIITFTLPAGGAVINVATSTTGGFAPYLVGADGKVWAANFTGKITVELPQGTYFICTGQKDKESTITALSFSSSAESSAIRVQAATDAINAIPANVTLDDEALIKAAQTAYSGLLASEKASFNASLKDKLDDAVSTFNSLKANEVIALINAIGTVNENSYSKINAAQTAYNALTAEQKALVTNYKTLADAQTAFAGYAVSNFKNTVDGLVDVSTISITDETAIGNAKAAYIAADEMYADFDEDQKAQVAKSYIDKITQGLETLNQLEKLFVFKAALAEVDAENVTLTTGASLEKQYNALNEAQKSALTADEKSKYEAVSAAYAEVKKNNITCTFLDGNPSNEVFKSVGSDKSADKSAKEISAYGGSLASGLKFETNTKVEFTIATKMVLTIYLKDSGKKVKIDGTNYTSAADSAGDNVITVELEAGTHYLEKNNPTTLYYATLSPAN